MSVFIDASALVAIVMQEDGYQAFNAWLDRDQDRLWSAMSQWETVAALCFSYECSPAEARARIDSFAAPGGYRMVAIGPVEGTLALAAYETYGKGRHPASLNMGDCFAYACAKANGAALLYKGDDFAQTDLA